MNKSPRDSCGSGLAREGGVSVATCSAWHTAIAGKPAPTEGMCLFELPLIYVG